MKSNKNKLRGRRPLFIIATIRLLILASMLAPDLVFSASAKELIIKLKPNVKVTNPAPGRITTNSDNMNKIIASNDIASIKKVFTDNKNALPENFKGLYKVTIPDEDKLNQILEELKILPDVAWAEPNYALPVHFYPNDSLYSQQWSLEKMDMPRAWDIEQGNAQIIVGVIDTGIDYLHPDLQGQLWINASEDINGNGRFDPGDINGIDDDGNGYVDDVIGWDFTDAPDFPDNGDYLDPDNDPMDEYPGGHGTPVAGIIAAKTNNTIGIAGIAPNVKVMALRAGTASGYLEEDDVAKAIIYAVQNGCKIINMSFGDVVFSYLLKEAVEYGYQNGILFVASAGNSGNNTLQYPASYDETISVGATDIDDNLASFSSFGSKLDLVAPGQDILSTSRDASYGNYNGTSFSAPMVSGVLALLWSHHPQNSAQSIEAMLLTGCQDLGFPGWDQYYGQGLANAFHSFTTFASASAKISSPQTNSGTNLDLVPIIGTAVSPNLERVILSYGMGENPVYLTPFLELNENVLNDTLGNWDASQLSDAIYTLELKVMRSDGTTMVDRVIINLDRTPPVIDSLHITPVVVENYFGSLLEVTTDDVSQITLYYRNEGDPEFSSFLLSNYLDTFHSLLLTQKVILGNVEVYFKIVNNAGLETIDDNNGFYYHLDLSQSNSFDDDFVEVAALPGFGYYLERSQDIDGNGVRDIFGNVSWPNQTESRISHIAFENNQFVQNIGPVPGFARDIKDINGDGLPELLTGYGSNSSIFPGTALPQLNENPVTSGLLDFWAAKMVDLDDDNQYEIIGLHQNQWNVFELQDLSTFTVSIRQVLENPTTGENNYGVPFAEVKDLNQNGKLDLVIGDYDGDLIVYELSNDADFIPVAWVRLPGVDATRRFVVGNFNGDPFYEIAVATKVLAPYIGESAVNRQYWVLSVLKLTQSNNLEKVWETNFHQVNEQKNNFTGVSADDFDGDGLDEIFFTPFPHAYYIKYQNSQYQLKGYLAGMNTNAVLKISDNQICVQGDSTIIIMERESPGIRPLTPADFQVIYVDSNRISLKWEPVMGAESYLLSRRDLDLSLDQEYMATESFFIDSTVISGHLYQYKILSIDSSYNSPRSKFSEPVKIRAENLPVYTGLEVEGDRQLLLNFSRPLGSASTEVSKFLLYPEQENPAGIISARAHTQLLLSFSKPLESIEHQIVLYDLENEYGVPFYQDSLDVSFNVAQKSVNPFVKKVEMISKTHLVVYFNHPMEQQSVENTMNYQIYPDDHVVTAGLDSLDQQVVHLYLTGKNRMGSLGEIYYLEVRDVKDVWDQPLLSDLGNKFEILQKVDNLSNIVVYPNPFRMGDGRNEIMFANLPNGCEIFIYTANGKKLIDLANDGFTGGVRWDLKNEWGDKIASGVYVYVVRYKDEQKTGKFLVIN